MLRFACQSLRRPLIALPRHAQSRTIVTTNGFKHSYRQQPLTPLVYPAIFATAAGAYFLCTTQTAYAEAQDYVGTVQEPETKLAIPIHIQSDAKWWRLVGMGTRQVTFMHLNVYVVGLYMQSEDIGRLRGLKGWAQFDKSGFLDQETMAMEMLDEPIEVTLRIVPVRTTNTQHLRDGFTRSLLQRMRDQSSDWSEEEQKEVIEAIREFKTIFISSRVKKNEEFLFTKTRDGGLRMEYEGKELGTVANKWLATNFVMGYLNPSAPASEAARKDIANGFEKLLSS